MGGSIQWHLDRGTLVNGREETPHKLPGIAGRILCHKDICQTQEQCPHTPKNGQQHSSSVCEQDGGHSLTKPIAPSLPTMAVVPTKRHPSFSGVPPRQPEHYGRPRIQAKRDICRVDAQQGSLPVDPTNSGSMQDRFICNPAQPPASGIHQLEARPLCTRDGCLPDGVEVNRGLCIPSLQLNREVHTEGPPRTQYHHNSSSLVALPSMVPSPDGILGRASSATAQSQRPAKEPIKPDTSTARARKPAASRLQNIRRQHTETGVSAKASDLLLAGWSKATNTAYQSGWARWSCWCSEREVDPISCSIQPFIDFLADLYEEGLQYRTINSI